jgi:hypothetical protein
MNAVPRGVLALALSLAGCGLSDADVAALLTKPDMLVAYAPLDTDGADGETWEEWDGTVYVVGAGAGGVFWSQMYHALCPTLDADEAGRLDVEVSSARGWTEADIGPCAQTLGASGPWGGGGTQITTTLDPAAVPLIDTGVDDDSCLPPEAGTTLTVVFDVLKARPDDGEDAGSGGDAVVVRDVEWEMPLEACTL